MEDLAPLCTMEEAAGFAVDDIFEATPLGVWLLPIVAIVGAVEALALSGSCHDPRLTHEAGV